MPRPNDTPDVKASKGLAYILRHGAEKEGLDMRSDGYIKLRDVVSLPTPLSVFFGHASGAEVPAR